MDWISYLDFQDTEGFHREDYFLAQIAAEVKRSWVKNPEKVSAKEFLLKFSTEQPSPIRDKQAKANEAKRFFLMSLGVEDKVDDDQAR